MRFCRLVAVAAALALAGCGTESFEGVGLGAAPGPTTSVLLLPGGAALHARQNLRDGLKRALEGCGVQVTVFELDPFSLEGGGNDRTIIAGVVARTRPDAVLSFAFVGGRVDVSPIGFTVRLTQVKSGRNVWTGKAAVSSESRQSGERVGAGLVRSMAQAGVISGC